MVLEDKAGVPDRRFAIRKKASMPAAIAEALAEIAAAVRVDGCRLLEFAESANATKLHAATGTAAR